MVALALAGGGGEGMIGFGRWLWLVGRWWCEGILLASEGGERLQISFV